MSRLSTVAVSTRVPALKVLSTTLPDRTFFSLVRTKAPPLPGLTCWNSTTFMRLPSMFRVIPFFRSLVVGMGPPGCSSRGPRTRRAGAADGPRRGARAGHRARSVASVPAAILPPGPGRPTALGDEAVDLAGEHGERD